MKADNDNIIITADSTCDLSQELTDKYNIKIIPIYINLNGVFYKDGVDITPKQIFKFVSKNNQLPKTAAVSPMEYAEIFRSYIDKGYDVIHVGIGSEFSSTCQNAFLAATEFNGKVNVIDSANLSTGSGHIVIELAELIKQGTPVPEALKKIKELIPKVDASFVLDNLEYMCKGGRCSAVMALGANVLKIKPSIEVIDGIMDVGKKYRGNLPIVLKKYVTEKLSQDKDFYKKDRVFITSTCQGNELVEMVKTELEKADIFDEILITTAGCTITCHCGPDTLGILFVKK